MSDEKETPASEEISTTTDTRTVTPVSPEKASPNKARPEIPTPVYRIVRQSEGDQAVDEGCDQEQGGYQETKLR